MFPLQWLAWNKFLEKAAPQRASVLCGFLKAHSAKISVLPPCPASIVRPTASVAAVFLLLVFLLLSIPSDSGSGLDPDISPASAEAQAARVAKARGASVDNVEQLIRRSTKGPDLGFLGQPRVNVLKLNLELDRQFPHR